MRKEEERRRRARGEEEKEEGKESANTFSEMWAKELSIQGEAKEVLTNSGESENSRSDHSEREEKGRKRGRKGRVVGGRKRRKERCF